MINNLKNHPEKKDTPNLSEAAHTLQDPNSSPEEKSRAASALGHKGGSNSQDGGHVSSNTHTTAPNPRTEGNRSTNEGNRSTSDTHATGLGNRNDGLKNGGR